MIPAPPLAAGKRLRLRIAASDVSIARAAPNSSSILNVLPARIVSKRLLGHGEVIVVLALGADGRGTQVLARITLRSWDQLGLAEAITVYAQVKGVSLASGPDDAGRQAAESDLITRIKPLESAVTPDIGTPIARTGRREISSNLQCEAP
jgi:molybdate transport system ATP-binding protein